MEKKSIQSENGCQSQPKITYTLQMKVAEQPFIKVYEFYSLEESIKAALNLYASLPVLLQLYIVDNSGLTHLTLNRYV